MKDIDLKTIFIGIFVLAFIFFGYQRMDVGRYQIVDVEYHYKNSVNLTGDVKKVMKIDSKTGRTWVMKSYGKERTWEITN